MVLSLFKKNNRNILFIIKQIIICISFIIHNNLSIQSYINKNYKKKKFIIENSFLIQKIKQDYNNNRFIILRDKCTTCGLFAYYKHFLGCMRLYLSKGYIPLVDLNSIENFFNGFNISSLKNNPFEFFFNQPFEFKLQDIEKKVKNLEYVDCNNSYIVPHSNIFKNKILMDYWHNIAMKYLPIKIEIIKEANIIKDKLFKGSINILGILARGTDYLALKPKNHPRQPNIKFYFYDIKRMNDKNKYDYFFLTTEDEIIRKKFIKKFGKKLKFYKNNDIDFKYNYTNKKRLCFNKQIMGNLNFMKVYLINIIILSKCIDIITSLTSGAIAAFIFSEGFRNKKVYYLGSYK